MGEHHYGKDQEGALQPDSPGEKMRRTRMAIEE